MKESDLKNFVHNKLDEQSALCNKGGHYAGLNFTVFFVILFSLFVYAELGRACYEAVGIDFGASTSTVAVFTNGELHVVLNDASQRSTPSCVYVDEHSQMFEVGETELQYSCSSPQRLIQSM